ncbi:unnamed protein product [Rotaria sordida]|uniref:Uncharacterized protein n=1 Tax=Rotaria sordida TaxID=392033 RepID=A0A815CP49_9BILA|nr:unnamed protein product [Rotaria sordida]
MHHININKWSTQHLYTASSYNSIGEIYRKQGNYNKALEYYDKALETLEIDSTVKAFAKKAVCYNNIGIVNQEQNQYKEALDFYMKAFKIRKDCLPNDETSLGMSYNNMGNAYYFLKLYADAIYHYQEALKIY